MRKCKNCGNIPSEDATFCSICGHKLDEGDEIQYASNESLSKKPKSSFKTLIIILIIVFSFLLVRSCVLGKTEDGSANGITERALTSSDYSISTSEGFTSITVTITAKRDIKRCNVAVTLYDDEGDAIYSDTITKDRLLKGNSYTYQFDYGFMISLSANTFGTKVTGTVSLI